jgi:endonuclease/exonuclease/phosphatase (EEP) superfamily protein YafD
VPRRETNALVRRLGVELCCIAPALLALGCGQRPLEPRDPTPGVPHFTIATYNVMDSIEGDVATRETIGATHADIICLEEVTAEWERVIRERYAADYPFMVFYAKGGAAGLGVLSKQRLIEEALFEAPNNWHPAWSVLAETPAGWLNLLTVHLRSLYSGTGGVVTDYVNWGSDHVFEIKSVLMSSEAVSIPAEVPRMVLGDFNEESNGDAVEHLESLGFTDVLPQFRPGQFTWRSHSLGNQFNEALDHILYDGAVTALNAYVVNAGHSDHIPVVAHFEAAHAWSTFDPDAF